MAKTQVATICKATVSCARSVRRTARNFPSENCRMRSAVPLSTFRTPAPFAYYNEEAAYRASVNALAPSNSSRFLVGDVIQVHTEVKQEKLNPQFAQRNTPNR